MQTGAPSAPQAVPVRLRAVHKRFLRGGEQLKVLDGVNLDVEAGEFLALMGPSGVGKSTLLHIIAGLQSVTDGKVWVGQSCVTAMDDSALARLRLATIGFVFQTFQLLPTLSAVENVVLPLLLAGANRRSVLPAGEALLAELGLNSRLHHLPEELSVGEKQRVCIARALVASPTLLLADEPTASLDGPTTDEVMRLLRRAVKGRGQTVILATHDARAAAHADRVLQLRDGRLLEGIRGTAA